jgi:NTE family protein
MTRAGLHWVMSLLSGGLLMAPPRALFDNTPLRQLLAKRIQFRHLQRSLSTDALRALAICASSYTSASSVAFFESVDALADWQRLQRIGRRTRLRLDHVMASLGVPLLFPPVKIDHEYYGDGAQRQLWPLSPAIHLGADRLLVIGVRAEQGAGVPMRAAEKPPNAGQLFGYMLDTLFMDQIYANIEHVARLNQIASVAPSAVPGVHKVATLLIAPSRDLRIIAGRHVRALPRPVRALLNVMGAHGVGGAQLASYLMFEQAFTCELIELGYEDACTRRAELLAFLAGETMSQTILLPQPRFEEPDAE